MWNKDEVKGKIDKATGLAKQAVGHAAGDPELEAKGQQQELKGRIKENLGTAKRKVGAAVVDIGRKINH